MKFLETNEYLRLIKICKEKSQHQSYAALYLIAKTGMRFAECLGLTVNDIDYT
ncbi:tyrosine-type recombinase/integrase, partial [Streptococcus agalactiae]|nr:tyrosine-type recombinase/integrase [Streptococcus agalactiae]MCC9747779.1 tyrosine-type recombinase/integrase [Streptococcus agalactiae]MCC9761535.1 tyrosine-type recombinase/integrase [Streptococcus agalactiae]MCC9764916.1 tyrosine-type recombinase/integrase [Streptococcus agalactiae]MCC9879160.1 tyrosine-type recombinase/integrase [Streptococcus agalactiae]